MHIPVMKKECIDALWVKEGGIYIDCTFGEGGHSIEILKKGGIVIGIDKDKETEVYANKIKQQFNETFFFINDSFGNIYKIWEKIVSPMKVDGILFDLGFSSNQIEDASRGFSFLHQSNMDMRYNKEGITALEAINTLQENELTRILFEYGEEPAAKKISKSIMEYRKNKKIENCYEFLSICQNCCYFSNKHFATKIFQALRIYVNNELINIEKGLNDSLSILKYYGRVVVLSFHSIEDRIVKKIFNNKNVISCPNDERAINNRSRSAKMRWFVNNAMEEKC